MGSSIVTPLSLSSSSALLKSIDLIVLVSIGEEEAAELRDVDALLRSLLLVSRELAGLRGGSY